MKHYSVDATREGSWWLVDCGDLGATQSRSLRGAEAEARDLISLVTETEPDSFTVEVVPDLGDLSSAVAEARALAGELEEVQRHTAERSRAVVAQLKQRGLSGNDTARILHVSPQRVSQLSH